MPKTMYIAGKIEGASEEDLLLFGKWESALRAMGFDVINPLTTQETRDGQYREWVDWMIVSLGYVRKSDAVFVVPFEGMSQGVDIECIAATKMGKKVFSADTSVGVLEKFNEKSSSNSVAVPQ